MSASKVRMGQAFVEIGANASKLFKTLDQANARIGKFASGLRSLSAKMTGVGMAMAAPIALATRQFSSFDDAIRATAAVSGAAGADLQALNDRARQLGESTSFTAVQVANLMTELGRAGFKPDEINNMTAAVLDLARATGTDATLSAGIMAATLRQFGLGATDATRAADVLTKTANATFNTVEGLGESLKYAGPVAKSLGMSLEDTAAILGVLGNVGIQGSEAGTALRRLGVISAGAGEELQKIFGVRNTDAAGQLKPLVQVLDEINTVTAGMPVAERTAKMAEAFGLLGITSANVLSQTAGGVTDLAEKLRTAEGTAAKTAKEMDAGLGGSFRIALSAAEGTALAIGDALAPAMQKLVGEITAVLGGITRFVKGNQELVVTGGKTILAVVGIGTALYGLGAALGAVSAVSGVVIASMGAIVTTAFSMAAGFASLTATVMAFKIASVTAAVASAAAWTAANLAMVAQVGFYGAVAAALSAIAGYRVLGSVFDGVREGVDTVASSFTKLRQIGVSTFGEIMTSIKAGDMEGAMQVAMNGLMAAFTVGSSAFLAAVDKWGVDLVNAFDFWISQIPFLRFVGDSYKFSVFGDSREGGNTPDARADARFAGLNQRNEARQAASSNAMAGLDRLLRGRATARTAAAPGLPTVALPAIPSPAPGSFERDIAALGAGQPGEFDAWMAEMAARQQREAQMFAAQRQMQAQAASQAEVAGTFSAQAVAGMGFGGSLQQQMADYARRTAEATEQIAGESFLAVIDR